MKLTRNFSLEEFVVSSEHPDLAKQIQMSEADRVKAKLLAELYLQPVRSNYGKPVIILFFVLIHFLVSPISGL